MRNARQTGRRLGAAAGNIQLDRAIVVLTVPLPGCIHSCQGRTAAAAVSGIDGLLAHRRRTCAKSRVSAAARSMLLSEIAAKWPYRFLNDQQRGRLLFSQPPRPPIAAPIYCHRQHELQRSEPRRRMVLSEHFWRYCVSRRPSNWPGDIGGRTIDTMRTSPLAESRFLRGDLRSMCAEQATWQGPWIRGRAERSRFSGAAVSTLRPPGPSVALPVAHARGNVGP